MLVIAPPRRGPLDVLAGVLLAAIGLAIAAGCAPSPTQLVVVVDTDLQIPAQLDEVSVTVSSETGVMETERERLITASSLPLTVAVIPSGESLGPIEVVARGSHRGSEVVERRARVTLVRGESRMLVLHLVASCVGVACEAGASCGESGCRPVEIAELPPWPGTPPRLGVDAGMPDGGPRDAALDAERPDAQLPDASMPCDDESDCDDGLPCTTDSCAPEGRCAHAPDDSACDDGQVCTDDLCQPAVGCVFPPAEGPCDDGVFCNGLDQCAGGTCAMHAGDPCDAPTTCDEAMDRCRGCASDADCPADSAGTWGACAYSGTCDESGSRSRTVRSYACTGGECVPTDDTESEPCTRDTDGSSCGVGSCGSYGPCSYADACAESGTQSRTCTDLGCRDGMCRSTSRSESQACSRDTDGATCAATSCGSYGACDYSSTCDESATQSRTCEDFRCGSGSCGASSRSESQACTRDTDGASCGAGSACSSGSCVACAPTLSGAFGTVGTSYLTRAVGSGSSLTFTDGATGMPMGSISAAGATFSGTASMPICIWQVHGMGDRIRFVDWDGTTVADVLVSGASVSGSGGPPCTPGPYGCFPPCLARVVGTGTSLQLTFGDSSTATLSFGCP